MIAPGTKSSSFDHLPRSSDWDAAADAETEDAAEAESGGGERDWEVEKGNLGMGGKGLRNFRVLER